MIGLVLATALVGVSPGLDALETLADAIDRCAVHAGRLDHGSPASVEQERRATVIALADAYAAFVEVLKLPAVLTEDDIRELAQSIGDASRALRDWTAARDALDRRWMRSAARELREAIERAAAVVSAAETASG